MEDFIIILIGFALMIYSAYSKNKKAKKDREERQESYDEPGSEREASEDILEQFFGYEPKETEHQPLKQYESEQNDHAQEAEQVSENKKWQALARESLQGKNDSIYQQSNKKQEKAASISHVNRRNASAGKKYRHWFNLRNAVIYSEILNRRY